jgi:hypothetical protein
MNGQPRAFGRAYDNQLVSVWILMTEKCPPFQWLLGGRPLPRCSSLAVRIHGASTNKGPWCEPGPLHGNKRIAIPSATKKLLLLQKISNHVARMSCSLAHGEGSNGRGRAVGEKFRAFPGHARRFESPVPPAQIEGYMALYPPPVNIGRRGTSALS